MSPIACGLTDADTGHMGSREALTNSLILIALWAGIAAAFLALQRDASWTVLFPATGLIWTAAPLILTKFPTRSLIAGSIGALVAAGGFFLALVWLAVAALGLFLPLVTETAAKPAGDMLALELALEGLKFLPGAAVGVLIGVILRRWGLVVPTEAATRPGEPDAGDQAWAGCPAPMALRSSSSSFWRRRR